MDIIWSTSPNFWNGRNGKQITGIVNHITAGLMPGCLSWMKNPVSKASAHYLVTRDGKIYQLVKEGDSAFHSGIVNRPNWKYFDGTNPNRYTIGIEHEALEGQGLTELQYKASLWLHKSLVKKYPLLNPKDRDRIIGHNRLDSLNRYNDPGPKFPWDRLFKDLLEEEVAVVEKPKNDPDLQLIVWARESKANEAKEQINKLGYACEILPIPLSRIIKEDK